jgi:CRP-like cAMP-binding protein
LALARDVRDPWVREAARIVEAQTATAGPRPATIPGPRHTTAYGSHDMMLDEQDLERVLVLKRISLFRYLSLDTLLAVSRAMQLRQYLPGEIIVNGRDQLDHCHLLEAGTVSLSRGGGTESLAAPACLNELVLIGEVTPIGPIVALEPCRVLLLHAVVLQDLSRDYPEILLELCRNLARRIRAAEVAALGASPVRTADAFSK